MALIIVAPLPAGGSFRWAWAAYVLLTAVLALLWLSRTLIAGTALLFPTAFYIIPLAAIVLPALQLIPLSDTLLAKISPTTALRWNEAADAGAIIPARTLSLIPSATQNHLLLGFLFCVLFFLILNTFRKRENVFWLAVAIVSSAWLNAVLGIVQGFGDGRKPYWYLGVSNWAITGTFLNKNHFTLLLEMGLPVALGLAITTVYNRNRKKNFGLGDDKFHAESEPNHHNALLLFSAAALVFIIVALLFGMSRAGTTFALLGLVVMVTFLLFSRGRKWKIGFVGGSIIAGIVFACQRGLELLLARYEKAISGADLSGTIRFDFLETTLTMIRDYWRTGVGLGAYSFTSPRYESVIAPDRIGYHAANNWLELLAEVGVPIGITLLGFGVVYLVLTTVQIYRTRDPLMKWIGIGAVVALASIFAHELFGFGLRKPGNLIVATSTLAMAILSARLPRKQGKLSEASAAPYRFIRLRHWPQKLTVLIACGFCLPFIAMAWPRFLAGFPLAHLRARTSAHAPKSLLSDEEEAQCRLELAEQILKYTPNNPEALAQKASSLATLGYLQIQTGKSAESAAVTSSSSSATQERGQIQAATTADLLKMAVEEWEKACGQVPTKGTYMAFCARAQELQDIHSRQVDETKLHRKYDYSHSSYPELGRVTLLCAEGAWRRYLRSCRTADWDEQQTLLREALGLFRLSIRQSPSNATHVYSTIWRIFTDASLLRQVTPPLFYCHEQLYNFLFKNRQLEECLYQLRLLEQLNKCRPLPTQKRREIAPYLAARLYSKTPEQMSLEIRKRRILIAGLLEKWEMRNLYTAGLSEAVRQEAEAELQNVQELIEKQEFHQANAVLHRLRRERPLWIGAVLAQAQVYAGLGQQNDALRTLMGLLHPSMKVTEDIYRQVQNILALSPAREEKRQNFSRSFPLHRFLQGALALKAETGIDALAELDSLVRSVQNHEYKAWLHETLLHYYHALGLEKSGNFTDALQACSTALQTCPRHLLTAQLAQRLLKAPESTASETDLAPDWANLSLHSSRVMMLTPEIPIDTIFGGKIQLLGYTVTPRIIRPGDSVTIELLWQCIGDLERDYRITCRYKREGQPVFSDSFQTQNTGTSMVSWRIGELIPIKRTFSPVKLAALQKKTTIEPGWYDLSISLHASGVDAHRLEPATPCYGPAFRVVR